MSKKIEIKSCWDCPYLKRTQLPVEAGKPLISFTEHCSYDFNQRTVKRFKPIPEWCPLKDY